MDKPMLLFHGKFKVSLSLYSPNFFWFFFLSSIAGGCYNWMLLDQSFTQLLLDGWDNWVVWIHHNVSMVRKTIVILTLRYISCSVSIQQNSLDWSLHLACLTRHVELVIYCCLGCLTCIGTTPTQCWNAVQHYYFISFEKKHQVTVSTWWYTCIAYCTNASYHFAETTRDFAHDVFLSEYTTHYTTSPSSIFVRFFYMQICFEVDCWIGILSKWNFQDSPNSFIYLEVE